MHDFIDEKLGKAPRYGIQDLADNEGWVSAGDTAAIAVESTQRSGKPTSPKRHLRGRRRLERRPALSLEVPPRQLSE